MPKYTIISPPDDPNYRMMQSTENIRPGDTILSEGALVDFPVCLQSTHDPDQFLDPASPYNGRADLIEVRNGLSQDKQAALNGLYNMDRDNDIVNLFATNCFTEPLKSQDNHIGMFVRIYERISRVNHSCRPNAVVSWHPGLKKAFLRALRNIPQHTEIMINYYAEERTSFQALQIRRHSLRQGCNFTCNCEVCVLPGREGKKNGIQQERALKLYTKLHQPERDNFATTQAATNSKTAKIVVANDYISLLKAIDIVDIKLASAYEKLADLHHEMFDIAEQVVGDVPHCNDCGNNGGPQYHLELAWRAIGETHAIYVRVHGRDHPDVNRVVQVLSDISSART